MYYDLDSCGTDNVELSQHPPRCALWGKSDEIYNAHLLEDCLSACIEWSIVIISGQLSDAFMFSLISSSLLVFFHRENA